MYTRNLRILNSEITQKQLQKTKCKFRKQFSNQILLGIIKKDHYEIIKRKAWLKSKKYLSHNFSAQGWFDWSIWKPVFHVLDEVPVQRIYFTNYRTSTILYDIVHISFPKLRELHLQDNLISNLEPITAIDMPNLRKLDLRRNLIITIQCLRRCEFPRLQEFNLSDNIIRSCSEISDCYFPQLKGAIVEEKTHSNIYFIYQQGRGQRELKSNSRVNGYDLRWILKLQARNLEFIKISADARIIRKELQNQIGAKYYKIRGEKKQMEKGSLLPLIAF